MIFDIGSICFLNGGLFPAYHRPRLIQKLALLPIGPIVSRSLSKAKLQKAFHDIFGPDTKATAQEIDGHWHFLSHNNGQAVFHKLMEYMNDRKINATRWREAMIETNAPLRLINGGQDPISGKHLYDHYREIIPNADAVLLSDIGHYPQTEAPARVFDALMDFHGMQV